MSENTSSKNPSVVIESDKKGAESALSTRISVGQQQEFGRRQAELDGRERSGATVGLEREILALEREVFDYEHDNTGALIRERWGQDFAEKFGDGGARPLEAGPDGQVAVTEIDGQSHCLMVSMAELDRMNDEGGHSGGDLALQNACARIDEIVATRLVGGGRYEVYRFSGNQFAVNLEGVPPEIADDIVRAVNELSAEARLPDELKGAVKEAPPLIANRMGQDEILETLNQAQQVLVERGLGAIPPGKELERAAIELVGLAGDFNQETDKFINRCQRAMELVARGDAGAAKFFDQYLKKGLGGSEFADLDSFKKWLDSETGQPGAGFDEAVSQAADHAASRWLAQERGLGSIREQAMASAVLARRGLTLPSETAHLGTGEVRSSSAGLPPVELSGRKKIEALAAEAEAATPNSPEAKIAALKLEREQVRRDGLTGLERRRPHYDDLRQRLTPDATGHLSETSVVFVDMGYLKYFDKEGGRAVGNHAIQQAAGLMESVQRELATAGIVIEPRRYGGDEFVITVAGGAADAAKVNELLFAAAQTAGTIPRQLSSSDQYADTGLVFNVGVSGTEDLEIIEAELRRSGGLPEGVDASPESLAKWRAETLTAAADLRVKEQKALNRFVELYGKLTDEESWKESLKASGLTVEQIDAAVGRLFDYSQKAIFGRGADIRQWAEDGLSVSAVIERAQALMVEADDKEIAEKRERGLIMDLTIEAGVRGARYRRQIDSFKSTIERLTAEHGAEHEQVVSLRQQVERMEKEKIDLMRKFFGEKSGSSNESGAG